jgi:hypothetical protein
MTSYRWLVVIVREGVPEVTGFDDRLDAVDYFSRASIQWTESFFCEVQAGPGVPLMSSVVQEAFNKSRRSRAND